MYELYTSRLRVEIGDPEEVLTQTTRFDRTGFVTEVVLDRSVRFCASEPRTMKSPSSGGRGLCSEFCFDPSGEAAVGAYFPKFGVGLLRKTEDAPFCLHKKYLCIPFDYRVEQISEAEIQFRTLPILCLGYAAESSRRVAAEGNCLTMETELRNVGERPFAVEEYCHNFLSPDGMALGPGYALEVPGGLHMEQRVRERPAGAELFQIDGHTVRPRRGSFTPASFRLESGDIGEDRPFVWSLRHDRAGAAVEGTEFFRPHGMNIWGCDHMLCPEVFFRGSLQPGERCVWRRQWEFCQTPRNER